MSPPASRRLIRGWGIAIGIGIWILIQAAYQTWGKEELISLRIISYNLQPDEIPSSDPDLFWGLQYLKAIRTVKPSEFQSVEKRSVTVGVLYQSTEPFEVILEMGSSGSEFTFAPSEDAAQKEEWPSFSVTVNQKQGKVMFSSNGQMLSFDPKYVYLVHTDPAFTQMELRRYAEGDYPEEWPDEIREALPESPGEGN